MIRRYVAVAILTAILVLTLVDVFTPGKPTGNGLTQAEVELVTESYPTSYGKWERVPRRLRGVEVDLVGGGTRVVRKNTLWRRGDTTYFIWPKGGADVGTS